MNELREILKERDELRATVGSLRCELDNARRELRCIDDAIWSRSLTEQGYSPASGSPRVQAFVGLGRAVDNLRRELEQRKRSIEHPNDLHEILNEARTYLGAAPSESLRDVSRRVLGERESYREAVQRVAKERDKALAERNYTRRERDEAQAEVQTVRKVVTATHAALDGLVPRDELRGAMLETFGLETRVSRLRERAEKAEAALSEATELSRQERALAETGCRDIAKDRDAFRTLLCDAGHALGVITLEDVPGAARRLVREYQGNARCLEAKGEVIRNAHKLLDRAQLPESDLVERIGWLVTALEAARVRAEVAEAARREPPVLRCDPPWSKFAEPPSAGDGRFRCRCNPIAEFYLNGVRLVDAVIDLVGSQGAPWSHIDGLRRGRWTCDSLRRAYGPTARIMWDTRLGRGQWVVVYESAVRGAPPQVVPYTPTEARKELWTEVRP